MARLVTLLVASMTILSTTAMARVADDFEASNVLEGAAEPKPNIEAEILSPDDNLEADAMVDGIISSGTISPEEWDGAVACDKCTPVPKEHMKCEENGMASTYGAGDGFDGRKMADGQIFHASLASAAHKTLPLGTRIRIWNRNNGKHLDIVVKDRGPYVGGGSWMSQLPALAYSGYSGCCAGHLAVFVELPVFRPE